MHTENMGWDGIFPQVFQSLIAKIMHQIQKQVREIMEIQLYLVF